jgi:hypothetical protein
MAWPPVAATIASADVADKMRALVESLDIPGPFKTP